MMAAPTMGFLDLLFRRKPDPTAEWPVVAGTPAVSVPSRSVGFLRFGDPFEKARALGRPDAYTEHAAGTATLDYRSRGFAVEYELGRFIELAYFIGPGGMTPSAPEPHYVRPTTPGGLLLTPGVSLSDIRTEYGDQGGDEPDLLTYEHEGLVQEFAFESGRLATWTLYLNE
jgi:hypothetical protein